MVLLNSFKEISRIFYWKWPWNSQHWNSRWSLAVEWWAPRDTRSSFKIFKDGLSSPLPSPASDFQCWSNWWIRTWNSTNIQYKKWRFQQNIGKEGLPNQKIFISYVIHKMPRLFEDAAKLILADKVMNCFCEIDCILFFMSWFFRKFKSTLEKNSFLTWTYFYYECSFFFRF